jgi:F-type H+-transporting ATPase subunit delta
MKDRKLAARYARALLSALPDATVQATVGEFLGSIGQSMETSREIREALEDPATSRSARIRTLTELAHHEHMPAEMDAFLATVVDHGRIGQLPVIAHVYRELFEEQQGIVAATITTAQRMPEEQERRARHALETLTGKKIRLTTEIDETLIGGAITRVGSMVYDGSLRTQLESLRRRMAQE